MDGTKMVMVVMVAATGKYMRIAGIKRKTERDNIVAHQGQRGQCGDIS